MTPALNGTDIAALIGTRPEAIKVAPVVLALRELRVRTQLISTGQHGAMLDEALSPFALTADVNLRLMRPSQPLARLAARGLITLDRVYAELTPRMVMVQGDTTSAMVAAVAAYYRRIPVVHLEAGLRTGDLYQPFPEEGNRRLISKVASLHLAPTEWAAGRLMAEGVPHDSILVTGNTVIDALLHVRGSIPTQNATRPERRLLVVTMHRRENAGEPVIALCRALRRLVIARGDIEIVLPVHPSPAVREPIYRLLGGLSRVTLIEPLGYARFVSMLDACYLILTDSGGIQEEAPALGKPVLVLRNVTERPEAIRAGTSRLIGTDENGIVAAVTELLDDSTVYDRMALAANPYGDGLAAKRSALAIQQSLKGELICVDPFSYAEERVSA